MSVATIFYMVHLVLYTHCISRLYVCIGCIQCRLYFILVVYIISAKIIIYREQTII